MAGSFLNHSPKPQQPRRLRVVALVATLDVAWKVSAGFGEYPRH
jgi:hypothetical protein